jgi:hypothetical protein
MTASRRRGRREAGTSTPTGSNALLKYVASTSLQETTWNATLLGADVADEVAKLKQQPGGAVADDPIFGG